MSLTPAQHLMEQRAVALASPPQEAEGETTGVVVVSVAGGRRYAVESRLVLRVVRNTGLCRLPGSTSELVGLILVKGEAVPVADLGVVLGVSGADITRPLVMVLDDDSSPLGLLVDEVVEATQLPDHDVRRVEEPTADGTVVELGISPDGVVLLDSRLLLADVRLTVPAARHVAAPRSMTRSAATSPPGEPCET